MFAFRTYWSCAPGQHLHAIYFGLALLGPFYTLFTLVSRPWGHFTGAIYIGLALLGNIYTLFTLVSRSWGYFTHYLHWCSCSWATFTRYLRWSRAPGAILHARSCRFFSQVVVLSPCLDSGRFFGPNIATRKPSDRTPTHHDIEHSCSLLSDPF